MYHNFTTLWMRKSITLDTPDFNNARNLITREMGRITAYYRNSNFVVSSTHLLCQILRQLNVSMNRDLESYVDACYFEIERLARLFNLIHPDVANPEIRKGVFYNASTPEFILTDESVFDYSVAWDRWEQVTPVKIHYHGFTDLNCPTLTGNYKNPVIENTYAVISINIPLLALQFRAWLENSHNLPKELKKLEYFIYKYPLVNCMCRHMELAVINRTMNLYLNKPVAKHYRLHPLNVVNMTSVVDSALLKRVELIKTNVLRFHHLFKMFQGISVKDWSRTVKPPTILPNRNTKWVLEMQVIDWFIFWLKHSKMNNIVLNPDIIYQAKRSLVALERDAIFYKGANYSFHGKFNELKKELEGF